MITWEGNANAKIAQKRSYYVYFPYPMNKCITSVIITPRMKISQSQLTRDSITAYVDRSIQDSKKYASFYMYRDYYNY